MRTAPSPESPPFAGLIALEVDENPLAINAGNLLTPRIVAVGGRVRRGRLGKFSNVGVSVYMVGFLNPGPGQSPNALEHTCHCGSHRTAGTKQYERVVCTSSFSGVLTTRSFLSSCVWVFAGCGSRVGRSQLKRSSSIRKIRSPSSQFIDYQYTIVARISYVLRDRTVSDKGEETRTRGVHCRCVDPSLPRCTGFRI